MQTRLGCVRGFVTYNSVETEDTLVIRRGSEYPYFEEHQKVVSNNDKEI